MSVAPVANGHANGHAKPLPEEISVLIVGAGISGVNAAYRIQTGTKRDYCVIEQRDDVGGTWSLFQYPGIRSDSDLYTLGFSFAPWEAGNAIADGNDIYKYVRKVSKDFNIFDRIHFNTRLMSADWDSKTAKWTVNVRQNGQERTIRCNFLYCCTGYYDYDTPHKANIPGIDSFGGQTIHPQFWPTDFKEDGKEIVVIGSGATAVTLLPALADKAKHITMLQRSPSYFVAMPRADPISAINKFLLPKKIAHTLNRLIWAIKYFVFYKVCKAFPRFMKRVLLALAKWHLPKTTPVDPHFTPSYNPWDERVCFVPDGDMFTAIRSGKADIATDHIEQVQKDGIKLKSGGFLPADVIITATGLKIALFGNASVTVDGQKVKTGDKYIWKGFMLHGVPNLALSFGYTNISWSLGSDVTARHVVKLINKMDRERNAYVVPTPTSKQQLKPLPFTNLSSNYLQRASDIMPNQGGVGPWRSKQNWFRDWLAVTFDRLNDPTLIYKRAKA